MITPISTNDGYQVDFDIFEVIPMDEFRKHDSLPVIGINQKTFLASSQESNLLWLEQVHFLLDTKIEYLYVSDEFLATFKGVNNYVQISNKEVAPDSPAVRLVNACIQEAKRTESSDIHFEANSRGAQVRIRENGLLKVFRQIPKNHKDEVVSRLKIMASLDISEKRRPQDGRITFASQGQQIDIRVSIIPTDFGEKVVLRLLDQSAVELNLDKLGFPPAILNDFRKVIQRPNGLILVTGPTGSGKTTTLYSALKEISKPELNISTVEDPIEYRLDGINQTQVKPEIGVDFAAALRSLLRQDPNVILIGEIRDRETADLAIRASMTGHLVLSTLHTNDAPSAIARLVDIGVEPFLLSSSLSFVLGQRLIRKLCAKCQGHGCSSCSHSGFKGRVGIYESLVVNEEIQELINQTSSASQIRAKAKNLGWHPLREDGLDKVQLGLTNMAELDRETYI